MYKVTFDSYRPGYTKVVGGNRLAYTTPSELSYPMFTRVIALFTNEQCPKENNYYVGIIAEPEKYINKNR